MKTKGNILIIIALLLAAFPTGQQVQAQTTTTEDPAADYLEWPDDEVFFARPDYLSGTQMYNQMYLGELSGDLVNISPIASYQPPPAEGNERAIASGHLLDPKQESVVIATAVNKDLWVNFFQPKVGGSYGFLHYTDMFAATMGCSSFMDIAAGDLDDSLDVNYDYHEEAVLVYAVHSADNQLPVRVAVMDFTDSSAADPAPKTVTTATAGAKIDTSGISSQAWKCADNALGVSAGDFDGDGIDEIAVAYQTSNAAYRLDIFRYSTMVDASGQKTHSLSLWQSTTQSFSGMYVSLDIAADDFDGDGREEVAVATSRYGVYKGEVDIPIFSFPAPAGQIQMASLWTNLHIEVVPIRVQIASGLFGRPASMDGPAGPDLSARQLVVAYTCQLYAGDDYRFCMKLVAFTDPDANDNSTWVERDIDISYGRFFWLEAGGFKGPRTSDDYYWTLAVGRWLGGPYSNYTYTYVLDLFHPSAPFTLGYMDAGNRYWNAPAFKPPNRFPVVATDYDGDTVYLGAPMKLVMEEVYQYKMILQEPPKHAYWDKELQKVVTISRWDDFYVEFKEGADYDYKTSTRHETDNSYGLDAEAAISASKKFGGPLKPKEIKGLVEGTFEYDWGDHWEGYNSLNETYSYEFSRATTRDDVVSAEVTYFEVWRYPAYGLEEVDANGNTLLGYMDIVMPSALPNDTSTRGATTFEGWEPAWENGNILSYPVYDSACRTPADLGSFSIPCTEGEAGCVKVSDDPVVWKKEVHDVMAYGVLGSDATGGTNEISMTKTEGSGEEQTYSGSMGGNVDIKGYIGGKVTPRTKVEFEVGIGFHGESSWSDTNTTENTTTTTRSLYLTSPAPTQVSESYIYAPVLYVTQDGVMKLGYCVDLPGSGVGKDTWLELYGDVYGRPGKPDPALNLPYRFKATFSEQLKQNGWEPEPLEIYREQIRGFFVKEPELDPNVNDYLLLTHAPLAGEPVRLEVRVNNYSLSAAYGNVTNLEVKFEATTIDPTTGEEITVPIGTTVIPSLPQRVPQVAAINWTPPVVGFSGATVLWRVHVTLDPANKFDEIYDSDDPATYCLQENCTAEELIDPGQNNYGFRELSVVNPSGVGDPLRHQQRDIHLAGDAMLALNRNGRFDSGTTQVYLGSRVPVRVQVTTDKTSLLGSMVRLYEGDPQDGGTLLAEHRVVPGLLDSSGNVAWFLYMPMELGPHTLYAVVSESSDDLQPGNNIAKLKVVAIKEPKGPDK